MATFYRLDVLDEATYTWAFFDDQMIQITENDSGYLVSKGNSTESEVIGKGANSIGDAIYEVYISNIKDWASDYVGSRPPRTPRP